MDFPIFQNFFIFGNINTQFFVMYYLMMLVTLLVKIRLLSISVSNDNICNKKMIINNRKALVFLGLIKRLVSYNYTTSDYIYF